VEKKSYTYYRGEGVKKLKSSKNIYTILKGVCGRVFAREPREYRHNYFKTTYARAAQFSKNIFKMLQKAEK
jgi:hypothetical protein